MRKTIGILAHVDAGKTTFSEQALYAFSAIRSLGRVDHGNAFLDSHPLEKQRGITIFSDQAYFEKDGDRYFWVDTPGHVDFASEMERAVSILDYAVVIISASDGVQSHTQSIWKLLKDYNVPAFLFVNKMDRPGVELGNVMAGLKKELSQDCVYIGTDTLLDEAKEAIAERDEELLNMYLSGGFDESLWLKKLAGQIKKRELFPVFSGSALRGEGVCEFMERLCGLTFCDYDDEAEFSAKIYKIRHDANGERLCFFKVLSGSAKTRDEIASFDGGRIKLGELRKYHGGRFTQVSEIKAGELIAAVSIPDLMPGDIIGLNAKKREGFRLEPMMAVSVIWDKAVHVQKVLGALKLLEDEEPTLSVSFNHGTGSVDLSVMGPIQLEIIKQLMADRYGLNIDFGPMRVLYMETIESPVIGVGHYEPLRHYAEVHLKITPTDRGSGVTFESLAHVDDLALNWQRLIKTHVFEKAHKGVLIGAPLTDVKIELLCGRAHLKHTEGGDFRESTYRAIRNALMYSKPVLLEPVCRFLLKAPLDTYGRVMGDLVRMQANCDPPIMEDERFSIAGEATFISLAEYHTDFLAATHGRGSMSYSLDHYEKCRDQDRIAQESEYNPLADDTPDSVFCAHGAGFTVPWDQVKDYMHLSHEEFE